MENTEKIFGSQGSASMAGQEGGATIFGSQAPVEDDEQDLRELCKKLFTAPAPVGKNAHPLVQLVTATGFTGTVRRGDNPAIIGRYADFGLPVFPCGRGVQDDPQGKFPRTTRGFKDATTDKAVLKKWWDKWPHSCPGMPTGDPAGLVVVDVDRPKLSEIKDKKTGAVLRTEWTPDGLDSLAGWVRKHGPLPATLVVKTPGKQGPDGRIHHGLHICYLLTEETATLKNSTDALPGIDVRATGGYIIAPGATRRDGGKYVPLLISDIAEMPADLCAALPHRGQPAVRKQGDKPTISGHAPMRPAGGAQLPDPVMDLPAGCQTTVGYNGEQYLVGPGRDTAWGVDVLTRVCADIEGTPEGARNSTASAKALHVGNLVVGGWLSYQTAIDRLWQSVSQTVGGGEAEARAILRQDTWDKASLAGYGPRPDGAGVAIWCKETGGEAPAWARAAKPVSDIASMWQALKSVDAAVLESHGIDPDLPVRRDPHGNLCLRMETLTPPDPDADDRHWSYELTNILRVKPDGTVITLKGAGAKDCAAYLSLRPDDEGEASQCGNAVLVCTDIRAALLIDSLQSGPAVCAVSGPWALKPVVSRLKGAYPDITVGLIVRSKERWTARQCALSMGAGIALLPDDGLPGDDAGAMALMEHLVQSWGKTVPKSGLDSEDGRKVWSMVDTGPWPEELTRAAAVELFAASSLRPYEGPAEKREIYTNPGCLDSALRLASRALVEQGRVYQRSGTLVSVERLKAPKELRKTRRGSGKASIPAGTPTIQTLTVPALSTLATRAATWQKTITLKDGSKEDRHTDAKYIPNLLESITDWNNAGIPVLRAVTSCPVITADGDIIASPGYDPNTGLYCSFQWGEFPAVRDADCTLEGARQALETLAQPLVDFPFKTPVDKAVVLAGMLTAVCRQTVENAPVFGFTAPVHGTGKTILSNVIAIMATGRKAAAANYSPNEDEFQKAIFALVVEGPQVVLIDNIEGLFNNTKLNSALTSGEVKGRILGKTQNLTVSTQILWLINGNNLTVSADMTRRTLLSQIDPQCDHPAERQFIHPDLEGWIQARRPRLVHAALTILRAYHLAGRPLRGKIPPMGSYVGWSDLVRGALAWLGCADPLESQRQIEDLDPERRAAQALYHNWWGVFGTAPISAKQMLTILRPPFGSPGPKDTETAEAVYDALCTLARARGELTPSAMGYALRKFRGRQIDRLVLDRTFDRNGVAEWVIVNRAQG